MNLYDGKLSFEEKKHYYFWNDQFVPGVTTILGRIAKGFWFDSWLKNQTRDYWLANVKPGIPYSDDQLKAIHKSSFSASGKIAKDAAKIGTNAHEYVEAWFKKQELPELNTPEAGRAIEAFHKWLEDHHVEVLDSERMVMSKEFYYAGTCDFVAKVDGVLCVGDLKTSKYIYNEHRFQTAAYQHALEEEKRFNGENMKFPGRLILRLDKASGDFEAKMFNDFDLDFSGFLGALKLHKALQTIEAEV